jgi:uncharacterized protein (DUF1330 family)
MRTTFRAALLFALLNTGLQAQEASVPGGLAWLAQSDMEGPVTVIDLVKFKPGAEESYEQYDALAEAKLTSLGGEVIFRGSSKSVAGLDASSWDRVTMRKYPSASAVVEMGASSEYRAAFPLRLESVEASLVYAFGGDAMRRVAPDDSAEAVYMLNLLRFKEERGEAGYNDYGAAVMPLLRQRGGRPVLSMNGLTAVISDEDVDRMILVRYPSPESFRSMISSPEYRAIARKRTDSIELGLLFPFANIR